MSRLPSEELRAFVEDNSELVHIENNMMNLGWLPTDRLLYLDGQEESRFFYTIMEYVLIREKYRSSKLK
jgi:hypothetical protein